MSMVYNIGEGYYGVKATGRTIKPAAQDRLKRAYQAAMAIPDKAIVITDYAYGTKHAAAAKPVRANRVPGGNC